MAVVIGDAAIRLRPNSDGFSEEAQVGIVGPLGDVAKKAAGLFAAAFAAQKVGDFLKDSVTQASDLNESVSKSGVVFGAYAGQVQAFAANAASSMGLSRQAATESAATFGNLGVSLGLSQKQSADMSTSLVKLGGDLASFNNVDPATAIEALRSGLVGETEPLRQFGINLNQAALKQQALKMGLDASGPTLSASVQAQAAYALIMAQSTTAQGDFIRTSGGLANQQRIISAQFTDLKANVGGLLYPIVQLGAHAISGVLLPALLSVTSGFSAAGTWIGNTINAIQQLYNATFGPADALVGIYNTLSPFQARLASIGEGVAYLVADWYTFTDAVKGGGEGILATGGGIMGWLVRFGTGLHGVAQDAGVEWMTIRTSAMNAIAPLGAELAPSLLSIKASIGQALSGIFNPGGDPSTAGGAGFIGFLHNMIGAAGPVISNLIGSLGAQIGPFISTIASTVSSLVPTIVSIVGQIIPVVQAVLPVFLQVSSIGSTLFRTALQALLPVIPPLVTTIGQLVQTLVSGLGPILTALAPLVSQLIGIFVGQFKAVLQALVPIIPPLVSALGQIAQVLAGALLSVLQALMPVLPVLVQAFGQIAQAVGGALQQALSAIAPLLPTLINAFMALINAALLPLMPLLPALASLIPPIAQVIAALVQALAPFLPLIIQVVVTLVQLAVTALMPLMPVIQMIAGLIVVLVNVLVPLISFGAQLLATWLNLAAGMIGAVVGAISAVLGWFQRLLTGISGVARSITGFLGGLWDGLADGARAAFEAVTGVIKWAVNGYIGIINGAIGFINRDLIGTINKIPGVNIPGIPLIPKLHEGGEFLSGSSAGEGLALLRDREVVVTPEQRTDAAFLAGLFDGPPAPPPGAAGSAAVAGPSVPIYVTQLPGESGAALAARVSDRVVHNLNNGVTRTVGAGVPT